jgi:hypothetical protein
VGSLHSEGGVSLAQDEWNHLSESCGEPGVVMHACNPSTWKARQEDWNFEASLGYIVRPCLKTELERKREK